MVNSKNMGVCGWGRVEGKDYLKNSKPRSYIVVQALHRKIFMYVLFDITKDYDWGSVDSVGESKSEPVVKIFKASWKNSEHVYDWRRKACMWYSQMTWD